MCRPRFRNSMAQMSVSHSMTIAVSHQFAAVSAIRLISIRDNADPCILRISFGEVAAARRAIVVSSLFCGQAVWAVILRHNSLYNNAVLH